MNYHSYQNKTVMSTVFKLKAVILFVCAFVVVNVSTAWGQGFTPVYKDVIPVDFGTDGTNWVMRGDIPSFDGKIGIKFNFGGQQQYAIFTEDDKFLVDKVVYDGTNFYYDIDYPFNVGNIADNYGYDGNFKPEKVSNSTMTNIPVSVGRNSYVIRDIQYAKKDIVVGSYKRGVYYRKNVDIHNFNIYLLKYTDLTSSSGLRTNKETTNISMGGLTPGVEYTLYKGEEEVGQMTGTPSTDAFMLLALDGTDYRGTINGVALDKGDNVFVLKDPDNNEVGTVTVKRSEAEPKGQIGGYPTWEIEVCQDPDKTAAEIDAVAQTDDAKATLFSAQGVTHGKGHWEVYSPNGKGTGVGGSIVSSDSENTKIDYLPLGESIYAWMVVVQEPNPTTQKDEVCQVAALIRVQTTLSRQNFRVRSMVLAASLLP